MTQHTPNQASPLQSVSNADYRSMVDTVGDYAIFMLDTQGRILTWNRGAQLLKGYVAEDIIGRHFTIFYSQSQIEAGIPAREIETAIAHGRVEDEGWRLRKDGSRFWASVVITAMRDADGSLRGFVKVTRDLTQRRQHEEMLRQSEEKFRLLVEGVRDYAIFMLDPDGIVVSWNLGAQLNKGYTAEEILGQHFSRFYPQEKIDEGFPQAELKWAVRDGRYEDEGWRLRKDGSRFWANVVITALHDHDGRHIGFAKVTRDLTENHRVTVLEKEGRQLTQFLAILGHELRNPLASISNGVAIMQLEKLTSPRLRSVRDVLARQVAQLRRLVDDLLDVGRIASGKVHLECIPVQLQDVVAEGIEAMEIPLRERALQLHTDVADTPLWIEGDKARLIQVLTNLLHNACKFTPHGGHIHVSLRQRDTHAELSVRDSGPGIPPRELQYVFKLFAQADGTNATGESGLGIGLNVVHQMVQRHGGDVSAFSTGVPGEGAEFVVKLPLVDETKSGMDTLAQPNCE